METLNRMKAEEFEVEFERVCMDYEGTIFNPRVRLACACVVDFWAVEEFGELTRRDLGRELSELLHAKKSLAEAAVITDEADGMTFFNISFPVTGPWRRRLDTIANVVKQFQARHPDIFC